MLIIVAPGVSGDLRSYLSGQLPSRFPGNQSFRLMSPNGAYVGPVGTRDELLQPVAPGRGVFKGYEQAIGDLAECRGERSIIYATPRAAANQPLDMVRDAEQASALIYHVGGDPIENYTVSGEPGTTAPPTSVGEFPLQTTSVTGAETWETNLSPSIRTVYVVRSMGGALKNIERVSKGWYQLTLTVPQDAAAISLRAKIPGQYQMSAVDWLDAKGVAPSLILAK